MEINQLIMLTHKDIEYNTLSIDTLKQLALGDELFIATSALGELSQRNTIVATSTAWEILLKSHGDCYLQAAALEKIFRFDREKGLTYIREQAPKCNTYVLNSILEIMIENEPEFRTNNAFPLISLVIQRLNQLDSTTQYPEQEIRNSFLNIYSIP